ncbi:hypothetical protein GCM10010103_55790 [Streptomyces paradoxus]
MQLQRALLLRPGPLHLQLQHLSLIHIRQDAAPGEPGVASSPQALAIALALALAENTEDACSTCTSQPAACSW